MSSLILALAFLGACSGGGSSTQKPDTGIPQDTGAPPDSTPVDSGLPETGSGTDTGGESGDTGSPHPDTGDTAASSDLCDQVPEGAVVLPDDDAPHDAPWEWWYWTGHLQDGEGRWYGFEHVFFILEAYGMTGLMVHHAITDIDAGDFSYDVAFSLYDGVAPAEGFSFSLGNFSAEGGGGQDWLHGEMDRSTLDLDLQATKAPVLQHGDGYLAYDFGGYTYYYSRERMSALGTLEVDGELRDVEGTAWFDHQWGELDAATSVGWDWFALQLDDGREYMIYLIHADDSDLLVGASLSDEDCVVTELDASQVNVTSTASWTSPSTGCTWPMGWELELGGEHYVVTPAMEDQELSYSGMGYWEGAGTVDGHSTGRAYVELTGYCGSMATAAPGLMSW